MHVVSRVGNLIRRPHNLDIHLLIRRNDRHQWYLPDDAAQRKVRLALVKSGSVPRSRPVQTRAGEAVIHLQDLRPRRRRRLGIIAHPHADVSGAAGYNCSRGGKRWSRWSWTEWYQSVVGNSRRRIACIADQDVRAFPQVVPTAAGRQIRLIAHIACHVANRQRWIRVWVIADRHRAVALVCGRNIGPLERSLKSPKVRSARTD